MPKDIIDGRIIPDTIARIPDEIGTKLKKHRLKAGDIIFGRRGDIGRCGLVSDVEENWYCGTGCIRVRLRANVNPRYLIHYLRLPETVQWLNDNAVGQTMLNLNTTILANLPIIVPSQDEQEAIANLFDSTDEGLERNLQEIIDLNSVKRGLMRDLLTGRVRVNG